MIEDFRGGSCVGKYKVTCLHSEMLKPTYFYPQEFKSTVTYPWKLFTLPESNYYTRNKMQCNREFLNIVFQGELDEEGNSDRDSGT
jgi:hypothetical protein